MIEVEESKLKKPLVTIITTTYNLIESGATTASNGFKPHLAKTMWLLDAHIRRRPDL